MRKTFYMYENLEFESININHFISLLLYSRNVILVNKLLRVDRALKIQPRNYTFNLSFVKSSLFHSNTNFTNEIEKLFVFCMYVHIKGIIINYIKITIGWNVFIDWVNASKWRRNVICHCMNILYDICLSWIVTTF